MKENNFSDTEIAELVGEVAAGKHMLLILPSLSSVKHHYEQQCPSSIYVYNDQ